MLVFEGCSWRRRRQRHDSTDSRLTLRMTRQLLRLDSITTFECQKVFFRFLSRRRFLVEFFDQQLSAIWPSVHYDYDMRRPPMQICTWYDLIHFVQMFKVTTDRTTQLEHSINRLGLKQFLKSRQQFWAELLFSLFWNTFLRWRHLTRILWRNLSRATVW